MNIQRVKRQFYSNRRRARNLPVENTLTWQEWASILEASNGCCAYCERDIGVDCLILEHRIPLSKGGANSAGNVTPACPRCNSLKSTDEPDSRFYAEPLPFVSPEGFYSISDLAQAIGSNESAIRRKIKAGYIRPTALSVKCKRTLLFDQRTLNYLINRQRALSQIDRNHPAPYDLPLAELVDAIEERGFTVTLTAAISPFTPVLDFYFDLCNFSLD